MKNKKLLLSFLIIICVLLAPKMVNALKLTKGTSYATANSTQYKSGLHFRYGYNTNTGTWTSDEVYKWSVTLKSDPNTKLYCLNPVLNRPATVTIDTKRGNIDPDTGSRSVRAYDAAVIYIYNSSGYESHKEIAMRLIAAAWNWMSNKKNTVYNSYAEAEGLFNAFVMSARVWINEDEDLRKMWYVVTNPDVSLNTTTAQVNSINNASGNTLVANNIYRFKETDKEKKGPNVSKCSDSQQKQYPSRCNMFVATTDEEQNKLNAVKSLFKNAIISAYNYIQANRENVELLALENFDSNKWAINGDYYERLIQFRVANTDLYQGTIIIKNVSVTNNSNAIIEHLPNGSGGIREAIANGTNLVKKDQSEWLLGFKVKIPTAKVTKPIELSLKIDYEYCLRDKCNVGYILMDPNTYKSTSSYQRFVYIDSSVSNKSGSRTFSIPLEPVPSGKNSCGTSFEIEENCVDNKNDNYVDVKIHAGNKINGDTKGEKYCILENYDEQNHSYKASEDLTGIKESNEACQVYCREDYDIHFDGKKYSDAGRFFKLGAKIEGSITCYTTEIDQSASRDDVLACYNLPQYMINNMVYKKSGFNFLDDNYKELQYKYDDEAFKIGNESAERQDMNKTMLNYSFNYEVCNSDVNDEYRCTDISKMYANSKEDSSLNDIAYQFSQDSWISSHAYIANPNVEVGSVRNAKYIKVTISAKAEYNTANQYYNNFPNGNITKTKDNHNTMIDGLPVSINASKGEHNYTIYINKLGQNFKNQTWGRLIGSNDSVLKKKSKDKQEKIEDGYTCQYEVNRCPDCDPEYHNTTSTTTLFDDSSGGAKLKVSFRTISPTNINPNNRTLGYNWNSSSTSSNNSGKYNITNEKAKVTIEEIERLGSTIENQTPILSVKMTPSLASQIRNYNKDKESDGGYTNETLICYNYKKGTKVYEKVFCYSELLDSWKNSYSSNFEFTSDRNLATRNNTTVTNSKYWTVFDETFSNKYTLGQYNEVLGGPSWK